MKILVCIFASLLGLLAASFEETCILEKKVGRCRAAIPRWYFDSKSGECKRFYYGGCGGNSNNFFTKKKCSAFCFTANRESCNLEAVVGPCRAAIPKWYFDSDSGECKRFYYGGCRGNANNFNAKEKCLALCSSQKSYHICPPCKLSFRENDVCSDGHVWPIEKITI